MISDEALIEDMTGKLILEMRLKVLGSIEDDSLDKIFKINIKDARNIALSTLYPYDLEKNVLPKRVEESWVVRCALELYEIMGQEGYKSYSENGLSWTKDSDLISQSLMNELVPNVGVPK